MRLKVYKIGDLVRLEHCHEVQGIVVDVRGAGHDCRVLMNGKNKWTKWNTIQNWEVVICE